jgi:UPF0042 nucleotide-binding protein
MKFPAVWKEINKKLSPRLIFLEASDEALVKRFSECRRPHPLTKKKSVMEGVRMERRRLAEIKKMADEVIDTSVTSVAQLKELLMRRFSKRRGPRLQIVIVSFGYKYGLPIESDLIFDTRFLPNPFYVEPLREKTGKAREVKEFVLKSPETRAFLEELTRFLGYLIPKFMEEGKSILTIAIGCTGGKHRSVVIGERLKAYFQQTGYHSKIYHRDIFK